MAIAANVPEQDAAVDPANAIYVNQGDDEAVQLESLCMNCHENVRTCVKARQLTVRFDKYIRLSSFGTQGTTTMLLTRVPHFRDLMVASFECPHCNTRYAVHYASRTAHKSSMCSLSGHRQTFALCTTNLEASEMPIHDFCTCTRNNEVSFTGTFGEQGVRYTLTVAKGDQEALSRQVVKSDNATITVPELEFEIPAATQKGSITTVEGLLMDAASNIRLLQEERRAADPTTAKLIDEFLNKLDSCKQGDRDFTVVLDDPAGNSYVESPGGNARQDPLLQVTHSEALSCSLHGGPAGSICNRVIYQ